jgi:hypothetical protein
MRSFTEHPELISASPLIVNKSLEIVDGNHRLEVLRNLGLPVYYITVDNANISDAQVLNVIQKVWTFMDFGRSYAASGNPHYQKFLTLYEEYPMAPTALLAVIADRGAGGSLTRIFKRGKLEITGDEREMYHRLEFMASFQPFCRGYGRRECMLAIYKLLKIEGLDHQHMLDTLAQDKLPLCGSTEDYLHELERRYNTDGYDLRLD